MNTIRILPENVANKIAAGEVVERPASVVKELLENAIDAGATEILVETQAGGVGLIRVSDNGSGMSRDDAVLALERHATSKIDNEDDITRVRTLGFRGEALPSIASVSRFEMLTKAAEATGATLLNARGGKLEQVGEASRQQGTTVSVADLFANIPARRKFLKTRATEQSRIHQVIRLAAMGHAGIGMRWMADGQEELRVRKDQSLKERIAEMFEAEIAQALLPVHKELGQIRVSGFAAKATVTRSNRSLQFFFVNGRGVQSPAMSFATRDGYRSLVMTDRHPVCFIFLDLPPAEVDVNVHPAKREIRFRQEQMVRDLLRRAVAEAVTGVEDAPYVSRGDERASRLEEAMGDYEQRARAAQAAPAGRPQGAWEQMQSLATDSQTITASAQEPLEIRAEGPLTGLRLLGQIHKLYLLLESPEGLLIVDQHAAHERVLFDQALKRLRAGERVESQKLLLGETIACDPAQARLLAGCLEDLQSMGLDMRAFGKHTFLVEGLPFFVKTSDAKKLLADILEELAAEGRSQGAPRAREERILKTLCRVAVRAADSLKPQEQEALIGQWMATENPYHCPHGRPTMLKFSAGYLARQFKRE